MLSPRQEFGSLQPPASESLTNSSLLKRKQPTQSCTGLSFSPISQATSAYRQPEKSFFRNLATKAQHDHQAEDKERYQLWLEGAMVKGMRPLYKAIRSHEQVITRPFQNKESALRPYLRYHQWEEIWQSRREPVEAYLPDLHAKAVEEARNLPPITVDALRTKLQCLPDKAPGADGWNNRMLKQLPLEGLQPLVNFLNDMEKSGLAPGQWRVVKFALLPKKVEIERPIGLCNVWYIKRGSR